MLANITSFHSPLTQRPRCRLRKSKDGNSTCEGARRQERPRCLLRFKTLIPLCRIILMIISRYLLSYTKTENPLSTHTTSLRSAYLDLQPTSLPKCITTKQNTWSMAPGYLNLYFVPPACRWATPSKHSTEKSARRSSSETKSRHNG